MNTNISNLFLKVKILIFVLLFTNDHLNFYFISTIYLYSMIGYRHIIK